MDYKIIFNLLEGLRPTVGGYSIKKVCYVLLVLAFITGAFTNLADSTLIIIASLATAFAGISWGDKKIETDEQN